VDIDITEQETESGEKQGSREDGGPLATPSEQRAPPGAHTLLHNKGVSP
jgi:hypothetical protein